MPVPNSEYLAPATSVKVGRILAAADGLGSLPKGWFPEDIRQLWEDGHGFGRPDLLSNTAAMWQDLVNHQVSYSVTDITNANNSVPSWSGPASQNYRKYLSEINAIITGSPLNISSSFLPPGTAVNQDSMANIQYDMGQIVLGLQDARNACYTLFVAVSSAAVAAAVAVLNAPSTATVGSWVAIVLGAVTAIASAVATGVSTYFATDALQKAGNTPHSVAAEPNGTYLWPEPHTDQGGGEDFNSITAPLA